MRIPDEKIDEIIGSANIVDVISGYIQLRKRGKNFIGLCPFHQEKTPSFTVSEEKQIFHCFGCHAGGNVFKFLMEFKSISFVEAVTEVADQFGIPLVVEEGYNLEKQTEQEKMFELNVLAAKYFSNNLLTEENGQLARDYFDKRKIKLQTQRNFGLGYALPGWDNFLNYANSNKVDLEMAKTLGLIDSKSAGGFYDKLRGRIIFPIFSPNGRVIAFGGRILENNDNVAKYLNSPESAIYSKRRSLYGLYHSKDEIRSLDLAIMVEGYMDLISLYQGGVKNVVASSGTALTDEQVQILSRYTKNIVVLFDADTAGQKAAMRSIEILLKQDFEVKILGLPQGEDPDSFINKFGKEKFIEELGKAQNFLEYQTAQFKAAGMLDDPAKMTEAIRELVKNSALVKDELKRNLLIKSIAQKFGLREKLIENEAIKYFKEMSSKQAAQNQPQYNERQAVAAARPVKENPKEKEIVGLLFEGNEDIIGHIFDNILPDDLNNPDYRELADIVYKEFTANDLHAPSILIDKIEKDNLRTFIISQTMAVQEISKKWEKYSNPEDPVKILKRYANDVVKSFLLNRIDDQIRQNNNTLGKLEDEADKMELMKINKELQADKKTLMIQIPFYEE